MVVGLGSGSTAAFALAGLAERVAAGLRVLGIPTSEATAALARRLGIPLASLDQHRRIDLTIDGADQVERGTLHLIKGLGRRAPAREDRRDRQRAPDRGRRRV